MMIVGGVGIVASVLAAAFWLWASLLKVPDNIDTFIPALQKIGRLNAYGALAASVAALCASITWLVSLASS
jgi:hypothetical protein